MKDVHALHHDDLLFVTFNDKGQSYGDLQPVLANFVDTIARNGALLPLSFLDWRQMPKNRLEDAWKLVIARFCISEKNKRFVMQMMGVAWRRWRTQVKSTSYDLNTPLQELVSIRPVPHGLYSEVWEILCQHWKVNENLLDEVVQRRLQDMSEGTQPIKVHADAFRDVFRPEHSGRCLGAGATPSQVFPNQCKRSSFYSQSCHSTADTTENLRAMEEKMKTKMKVQESQWRAEMEEQKAQLEREMEQMRRTQEQFQNFTRVMQNMIHGTVGRSRGPEMMPEQMTMIMANIM